LDNPRVIGCSLVPEPPAKIMPLYCFKISYPNKISDGFT
jgi:hypothetical protein